MSQQKIGLVLTRQRGQRVLIDHGRIVVTVVEIRGDKVRLGFRGPPDVRIDREEVADEIRRQALEIPREGRP